MDVILFDTLACQIIAQAKNGKFHMSELPKKLDHKIFEDMYFQASKRANYTKVSGIYDVSDGVIEAYENIDRYLKFFNISKMQNVSIYQGMINFLVGISLHLWRKQNRKDPKPIQLDELEKILVSQPKDNEHEKESQTVLRQQRAVKNVDYLKKLALS